MRQHFNRVAQLSHTEFITALFFAIYYLVFFDETGIHAVRQQNENLAVIFTLGAILITRVYYLHIGNLALKSMYGDRDSLAVRFVGFTVPSMLVVVPQAIAYMIIAVFAVSALD